MPAQTSPSPLRDLTAAAALGNNPAISDAIDTIVRELSEVQTTITAARQPRSELKESYESALQRLAASRGRPAYYPYMGSGIGNGPLVELLDGSVKWDMITGIGVHPFGHSDPDLIATALRAAISDTVQQGNLQFNHDALAFSELLLREAGRASKIKHCFLTNSGVIANESAVKICYQKNSPASRVLAFNDCFAGRTVTMSQIGDSAAGRVGIPLTTQVDYVAFYDPDLGEESTRRSVDQLKQYIARFPGQHACFGMELVQGEGGFNIAPPAFFKALMAVCKQNNIRIWVDEIQTFGRTNRMFHFEQLGLGEYIDVVTIGKMSQVCACLYTEEMNPKPGLLSGTFIGGTVELQVGHRILQRLLDENYYGDNGRNAKLQQAFRQHAKSFVEKHREWFPPVTGESGKKREGGHFDGIGGMMRLTPFGGDKTLVLKALNNMFAEGVIAFYCGHGPYHIRFLPPFGSMQPEQFADVFSVLERAFAKTIEK